MQPSPPQILGIDAAVDPKNVGLAVATRTASGTWQIEAVASGTLNRDLAEQASAMLDPDRPILLAVDSPLGWPAALGRTLVEHAAGRVVKPYSNELFTRETDRFVRAHTGLKPLEVGADRIARTARAALALIDGIRRQTGNDLPLVLDPAEARTGGLLETYPAATLKQLGLPSRGYKKPDARPVRRSIIEGLSDRLELGDHVSICLNSDHCLDAVLCTLTAIEFLNGNCPPPTDPNLAHQEGWIWFPN
jgi:predicted RNase H-like nuclease